MIKTNFPTDHVDSINYIVKRDGRRAPFVPAKIAVAIQKAFIATGQSQSDDYIMELADGVTRQIADMGLVEPGVEDIQDCVEEALLENGHINTARKYIAYRAERTRVREINTRLMKTYEDITFKDAKTSDVKRENANVNGDTAMGQMLKYVKAGTFPRSH